VTIKETLKKHQNIEVELLLPHILKKPKEFLFLFPAHELTRKQSDELSRMVKRRQKGEPVAYILGYKDFMGLRFDVNKDVLIPRPETEILVEKVVSACLAGRQAKCLVKNQKNKILDLGTGSGCIIISLAKMLPGEGFKFYGSDVSKKALKVAASNAKSHNVKIKFIHSDILQNVGMNFDIVIANLPYLPSEASLSSIALREGWMAKEGGWLEWKNSTSAETVGLKFEPKGALFTKDKGLFLIKRLLMEIAELETKPKYIFLEFDPRQKKDLHQLIKKYLPGADIKFYRDLNNFWRCARIIL